MRIILLALFALLAAEPAAAQLRFGVRAGANFARITGDDVAEEGVDSRTGILAGVFAEAPIAEIVNLHVGAQYSEKGWVQEAGDEEAEVRVDYIEVPALLAVAVPVGGLGVRLYLGPTVGFMAQCQSQAFGALDVCDQPDGTEAINSFDFGGTVGAGLAFGVKRWSLLLDGFYGFGFGSIDATALEYDASNELFSASAGLMFPVGD